MNEAPVSQKADINAMVTEMLVANGFSDVALTSRKGMRFVRTRTAAGAPTTFWLKKDWTGGLPSSAAVAFSGTGSAQLGDNVFAEQVDAQVANAKSEGAKFLLMVHVVAAHIERSVVLGMDDVGEAYRLQLERWPKRARNGASPQLWFHETRNRPDAECVDAVRAFAVPLSVVAGHSNDVRDMAPDFKTVWAEVQRRLEQEAFRVRVGDRCGWRCVVSGVDVREVLDAAHLPGRDWRVHNQAEDGVLLRTDLHRLLDRGLAELRDDAFWISEDFQSEHYAAFHGRRLSTSVQSLGLNPGSESEADRSRRAVPSLVSDLDFASTAGACARGKF